MLQEQVKITGDVFITVYDENHNVKETRDITNLVVFTGKAHIASRVAGILTGEGALISHVGVGTGITAPLSTDTTLGSQLGSRSSATLTHVNGTNTINVTSSISGVTGQITEIGMFNALTGGTMVCRTTFVAISMLSTDSLGISWTITII